MENQYLQAFTVGLAVIFATCVMCFLGYIFCLSFVMEEPDVGDFVRVTIALSAIAGSFATWLTWPLKKQRK
ncbi:hypothetical protein [Comamonas testosteroni]|uniref:hypothetical protein n=1 Tax=Comamonas testosteroni TaxID=285 RepID=UPI0012D3678D|nr:hypothetical protein [Comamonas testosteroni]